MALTKDEKIKKLQSLGVTLSGDEKVKDLDDLLASYNKPVPPENLVGDLEESGSVKDTTDVENETRTRIVVRYINPELGLTDRVFSLEDHGKHFATLAEQFAKKFDGVIEPAA